MLKNLVRPLFLIAAFASLTLGQSNIVGYVKDAQTQESLPAANIQIKDTYRGTISNEDGKFVLDLQKVPATIIVSYIGYQSKQFKITKDLDNDIEIYLEPIILEGEPIVVIAEDPAMGIMREVIRKKKIWREKLKTYQAEAYGRLIFENDSGIVSIAESIYDVFWDKDKGHRQVVKSKRNTANLDRDQNLATAGFIPNFYDDDIRVQGFDVIGPTHPDAFDYYEFKLIRKRKRDEKIVYDIEVIPTSELQPTLKGFISVLDEDFALLDIDLMPSDAILFPPPFQDWDLQLKQQFSNFGKEFWFPVDLRISGFIKIAFPGLEFPNIIYKRITTITDYQVNVDLPDSLYLDENITSVDSLSLKADTLFATKEIIPLSQKEDSAYQILDSTMTLQKAYKPTGFLADFARLTMNDDEDSDGDTDNTQSIFSGIGPQLWFNRVDELHAGINYEKDIFNRLTLQLQGGYKTGIHRWSYGADLKYFIDKKNDLWTSIGFSEGTDSRFKSDTYSTTIASILPLLALDDYFDYFWNKALSVKTGYHLSPLSTTIEIGLNSEDHSSVKKYSDYNIVWSDHKQRANPQISEGSLRSIDLSISYGGDYIPFGVVGQNWANLTIEHSNPYFLPSDFSFTRYQLSLDFRLNTFLTRRMLPNVFDIHFIAGTSKGNLPIQKYGIIDGNFYAFSPFGTLKSLRGRPYEGEKYLALFWEHNFRTVPFELLGLDYLARKGLGIIVYGGHGRTWISEKQLQNLSYDFKYVDHFHHEVGVSINSIFNFIRLDFTQRLDQKGFYVGLGMARFF